jgi:hypothetical protein
MSGLVLLCLSVVLPLANFLISISTLSFDVALARADDEIGALVTSIKHVLRTEGESALDFDKLKLLVSEVGHLTHKDWEKTMEYSARLEELVLPTTRPETGSKIDNVKTSLLFRSIFERVLRDGNWKGARENATTRPAHEEPWAVVVTGLNGIRKTTTIYQEWYKTLLSEALVVPDGGQPPSDPSYLPIGSNSFFRQLDHMIAVLANVQFVTLYTIDVGSDDVSKAQAVKAYSQYKDAVFARYRTLSEMVGIILCREAIRSKVNIMVETSGRDISMYKYVNAIFGDTNYRKLALHFTINDLSFAEQSVDIRMADEIKRGKEALLGDEDEIMSTTVKRVVDVNAGGPYGSEVLKGVQADSTRVWNEVWSKHDGDGDNKSEDSPSVSDGWYQACFEISGVESKPWTAESIFPNGKKGSKFEFPLRK